ncbi:alpha/beta hydrolase [Lysinibacillus fusiformis]|nr:alpha/beta hydrolase [Lysinibacillus fusiformis]
MNGIASKYRLKRFFRSALDYVIVSVGYRLAPEHPYPAGVEIRQGPKIAFLMTLYPMIDNRCVLPSNDDITDARVWNGPQNHRAWEMYLGHDYASEAPVYAAPLHTEDYSDLPPTYTFIGDLDPFRDETIEYIARLTKAGMPTEFHLYPGSFHGFESFVPQAEISQRAVENYLHAFKKAFA